MEPGVKAVGAVVRVVSAGEQVKDLDAPLPSVHRPQVLGAGQGRLDRGEGFQLGQELVARESVHFRRVDPAQSALDPSCDRD